MSNYYYLMTSLPMLKFSDSDVMSYDNFLSLCQGNVSEKDFKWLEKIKLNEASGTNFLNQWAFFYNQLSEELTTQRSKKLGKEKLQNGLEGSRETRIVNIVNQAVTKALGEGNELEVNNPLEAELNLLEFMYKEIDEMVGLHTFDKMALAGYVIKLQLLNRKVQFSAMDGAAEYKRLFSNMQSVIYNN